MIYYVVYYSVDWSGIVFEEYICDGNDVFVFVSGDSDWYC